MSLLSMILCFVELAFVYNLVNKANLVQNFLSKFISFLYMFRVTMCPSSGETTVFVRHVVLVVWYAGWNLFLLMMGTLSPETCREEK